MVCSTFAEDKKPDLQYDFWKNKQGITIQACLSGYNAKKVLWLLPSFIERNNYHKSLEVVTNIRDNISLKYDYIETNYRGSTCISYTLEHYKGWYNQLFQDISEDSFLIFGKHSIIIPESVFKDHQNINVKFNWNNFPQQINSNLDQVLDNKQVKLSLQDFDSLYYAKGYNTLYVDSKKQNKFIYTQDYYVLIEKIKPQLISINTYLKKHFPSININRNTFIFVENESPINTNPDFAYGNGQEFIQVVGMNTKQIFDTEFIRSFTHEYLHKIIGYTVKFRPEKSDKEFWFKEGFVDYLSIQILLEIWNIDNYMNFYNSRIYKYFALNMHKYRLKDLYNKYIYDEAGYIAGMFYASKLNNFIIFHTNGTNDLIGLLSVFISQFVKNNKLYFSEELFFKSIEVLIKKPFSSIEELRTNSSLLSSELLFGTLRLKKQKMQVPIYSYDLYELVSTMHFNNKRVVKMFPKSTEPFLYYLELINKNNKIEQMVLKPSYITKSIPQYELIPSSWPSVKALSL